MEDPAKGGEVYPQDLPARLQRRLAQVEQEHEHD